MSRVRETNMKNRTYYFFDDIINIKNIDQMSIKTNEKTIEKYSYLVNWLCDTK